MRRRNAQKSFCDNLNNCRVKMGGAATACARCPSVPRSCRPWRRVARRVGVTCVARAVNVQAGDGGASLEAWISECGDDSGHPKFDALGIEVRHLGDDRGYAGVAKRAIAPGDVLVRVPRSKMLTAADARACPDIGDAARLLSDERALVLKLLHEKFLTEQVKDKCDESRRSEFAPYIQTLPSFQTLEKTHPLLWSSARLKSVLCGSPTLQRVVDAKAECVADHDALIAAIEKTSSEKKSIAKTPNLLDVVWANAIVASRAFYLENVDGISGDGEEDDDDYDETDYDETDCDARSDDDYDLSHEFEIMNAGDGSDEDDFDDFDAFDDDTLLFHDDDEDVFDPKKSNGKNAESFDDDAYFMEDTDQDSDAGTTVTSNTTSNTTSNPARTSRGIALVPWADSLNHSPDCGDASRLRWNTQANAAELFSSHKYENGDQVFDTYGVGKGFAETFLAYGIAEFSFVVTREDSKQSGDDLLDDTLTTTSSHGRRTDKESVTTDSCDIPGSWFWETAGVESSELANGDKSDALSLLAAEEAVSGASHRASILGVLVAAGVDPETTTIRVEAVSKNGRDGGVYKNGSGGGNGNKKCVGPGALRWCAAVAATRAELFAAGWCGPLQTVTNEGLSTADANLIIQKLGNNVEAQTRAKKFLARLLSQTLESYPSFAKFPQLASGVGKTPAAVSGTVSKESESITEESGKHAVAVGNAAAALLLASEARAMRAALEEIVGWTE